MEGMSVTDWVSHEPKNEWEIMMKKVAEFHHKHNFAGKNGHDMGYRIALTVEELGELSAAITKGKPLEECAEEMADILILLMGHSIAMKIDLSAFKMAETELFLALTGTKELIFESNVIMPLRLKYCC